MTKASENKWLIVNSGVILTKSIETPIISLEEWFRQFKCRSYVTSGLRDANAQFRIIQSEAIKRGISNECPEIIGASLESKTMNGTRIIPAWLPARSRLLTIGFLVNPPKDAVCMFDYKHPKKGIIKAGSLIHHSPHFDGTSFDIGGRGESQDKTIQDELEILKLAFDSGSISGLISYTIERDNNALHCDCKKI
jgi:hypothetical protein